MASRKEAQLRPPGQMSSTDVLSDLPSPRLSQSNSPGAGDPSRTQSIGQLVFKLGTLGRRNDELEDSMIHQPHSAATHAVVVPAPNTTNGVHTTAPERSPTQEQGSHGLETTVKAANHDAIVKHFHLRRVIEDEPNTTELDGLDDGDDDGTEAPYAQRMVKAAKIREFRRQKSRRESTTVSVTHMIPVSSRRLKRWYRRLVSHRLPRLLHDCVTPFSPTGFFSKARGAVLLITMLVQLFVIPFGPVYFTRGTPALDAIDIVFDVVFVLDFLATCNTAYYGKPDQLEYSRRKIVMKYIRSGWPFWVDLLSSVPIDTIVKFTLRDNAGIARADLAGYILAGEIHSIVRFFSWAAFVRSVWFMRVVRATKEFWFRVIYSHVSYAVALGEIALLLLYVAHYVACLWRLTVTTTDTTETFQHPWELYASDLYSAAQLLQGQGPVAMSLGQSVYGSAAVLFGTLVVAFITGWVALVLINYNSNTSAYKRKLEMVFATMDKMQLPPQLRRRIHQYYNHLWFEHDSIDGDIAKFSHELSRSLGLEVRLFKYMDLVLSVSYWRNSSPDFVTQIMLSLDVRAYLPEDYIVRQGEVGDGLFLINRGVCELTSCPAELPVADGGRPKSRNTVKTAASPAAPTDGGAVNVRRLMAGHSFGELSLLMNYRRTADVRAVSYVEMCVLDRSCFQKLLIRYREDRQEVLRELVLSCIEKSAMRFIAFPWEDMVDRILAKIHHPSHAKSHTQLTPWEAADLIIDLISPDDIADETVTFGFRDFDSLSHFQLTPITMSDGVDSDRVGSRKIDDGASTTCDCDNRVRKMEMWQQQTLDRLASLESMVGKLVTELHAKNNQDRQHN